MVAPAQGSALRLPGFRAFFITYMLGMADNIEHVISYYVAFDKFNSTRARRLRRDLAVGPFLLGSVAVGGLNDRYD